MTSSKTPIFTCRIAHNSPVPSALLVFLFAVKLNAGEPIQETAPVSQSVEAIVAQNGMWGYDHKKQFQKKLLEFVSPVHKNSLITSQLVESLSKVDENSSDARKATSDSMSLSAASAMQLEQFARITEQSIRIQMMQQQGLQVGGSRSMIRAGGLTGKSAELRALADVHRAKVEELKARVESQKETRALQLEKRLSKIKELPLEAAKLKSGYPQNVILEALREPLLKYGYVAAQEEFYEKHINAIKLPLEDIKQIRLQLDAEGEPIFFNLTDSPADLGKLPYAMQHPDILPVVRNIEARLNQVRTTTNYDLYTTLRELSDLHTELERVSIATLGTARESALKGSHAHRIWWIAKNYRDKIRGILNRMEAEGATDGEWLRQSRFNPSADGENVLTVARYIVENGCRIAPGLAGTESAYLKLHMNLLRLQTIFDGN